MDIFHEQLVKIKPTATVLASKIIIWLMAGIISAVSLYAALKLTPILLFVAAGVIYFAYKSTASFNIEFEYSVTNGVIDIDKIINKSSRKRLFSFECKQIEKIVKYNKDNTHKQSIKVCTDDMDNALLFTVVTTEGKANILLSPNEKLIEYINIFLPASVRIK